MTETIGNKLVKPLCSSLVCLVFPGVHPYPAWFTKCVTVKPVYSGHLETSLKCPDYQDVLILQVSLHVNGYFGTIKYYPSDLIMSLLCS